MCPSGGVAVNRVFHEVGCMRLKITMDCLDLDTQAAFWCAATDYERLPGWADCYVNLRPRGDRSERPDLLLQLVPERSNQRTGYTSTFTPRTVRRRSLGWRGSGQFGSVRSTPSSWKSTAPSSK